MDYSREERAIIWLCACSGRDYRACAAALREVRDPGLLSEAFTTRAEKELGEFLAALDRRGYFALTVVSDDYPESLRAIPDPPLLLFGAGNRALLGKRKFCVVGSRITPPWAERLGRDIAAELSSEFVIVTGLAEGGDCAAVAGAMESGNLICVLPCGLDKCYPAAHESLKRRIRERGLLLSEYLPSENAAKYSFHARNRLLAGLSEGVLVLSAGERSGALITADRAAEYGRDVFAFPYNPNAAQGAGCNDLLKRGAYVTTCVGDVFACYGIAPKPKKRVELTPEEERLLAILREKGEMHAAELAAAAGMKVHEAAAALSSLEIKDLAVKSGGNRYAAI